MNTPGRIFFPYDTLTVIGYQVGQDSLIPEESPRSFKSVLQSSIDGSVLVNYKETDRGIVCHTPLTGQAAESFRRLEMIHVEPTAPCQRGHRLYQSDTGAPKYLSISEMVVRLAENNN